jgi:RNA polymerase sigma-70 factor (ECF subfamily)
LKGIWDFDRDPLAALRNGAPDLFEEFVRTEAGTFVGFFRRLGAGRAEAEDLTQDVFLKLFRSAPTYEARSAFGAYALRVARNAWIDRRRRAAVRPPAQSVHGVHEDGGEAIEPGIAIDEPGPDERAGSREELRRLEAAVQSLPERHLSVFELAVVQGLPYAQISKLLDIPVGTVKSRVFHAVRRLREMLERSGETR